MKKQFLISLAVVVILAPQISFAAWWNPLTWSNPVKVTTQSRTDGTHLFGGTATSTATTTGVIERVVEKTVFKDRIVTKTIDSPVLIAEIQKLKDDNSQLEATSTAKDSRILELKNQLSQLQLGIEELQTQHEDNMKKLTDECTATMRKLYIDINAQVTQAALDSMNRSLELQLQHIRAQIPSPATPSAQQVQDALSAACSAQGGYLMGDVCRTSR